MFVHYVHDSVVLMDLGYVTHAVHANSRLVYLVASWNAKKSVLSITGPPNKNIYPPGPAWIYAVVGGVPSGGIKVLVGEGKGPEVDEAALRKYVESHFHELRVDCHNFTQRFAKYKRRLARIDNISRNPSAEAFHRFV